MDDCRNWCSESTRSRLRQTTTVAADRRTRAESRLTSGTPPTSFPVPGRDSGPTSGPCPRGNGRGSEIIRLWLEPWVCEVEVETPKQDVPSDVLPDEDRDPTVKKDLTPVDPLLSLDPSREISIFYSPRDLRFTVHVSRDILTVRPRPPSLPPAAPTQRRATECGH